MHFLISVFIGTNSAYVKIIELIIPWWTITSPVVVNEAPLFKLIGRIDVD